MDEITILQAEILKTLASPRRIEILHALADGSIGVGRLAEAIGASQPNVSQHLATLRTAGIVEAERDGREVRYRLADPDVIVACALMRAVLERRLTRLGEMAASSPGPPANPAPEAAGRSRSSRRTRGQSRTSPRGRGPPATSSSSSQRTAASTASSSAGSEGYAMTTPTLERPFSLPIDPLARAIADVEGVPETAPQDMIDGAARTKELVIVNWSGDLDKVWPVLILSSTAAASGVRCKVFVTFWGLLPFVKDQKRIVGENWMQRMLTLMQRPGIDHLKLSKMNFLACPDSAILGIAQPEFQATQRNRLANWRTLRS